MEHTQINPFSNGQAKIALPNAAAETDKQRGIAEVQAAIMLARANPRDEVTATDRILNACCRSTLASSAIYSYGRGGAEVTGPSIRLAEAIAQQWGNLQFGVRELEQRNGESLVQAYAWDVQSNTRSEITFAVPHVRHTKQGKKALTDPRDVYEMIANQGARRLRACIIKIIPGDVLEAAVAQCEQTLKTSADTSPEALKKMLELFSAAGVSKEQIEKRIQRRLEAIQPAHVVSLRKIYTSLRDGMSTPEDWFEPTEEPAERPAIKKNLREALLPTITAEEIAVDPAGAAC
jgi:hypothetical protein